MSFCSFEESDNAVDFPTTARCETRRDTESSASSDDHGKEGSAIDDTTTRSQPQFSPPEDETLGRADRTTSDSQMELFLTPSSVEDEIESSTDDTEQDCRPRWTVARSGPSKRRNFCPFCKKLISNFSRHLVAKHAEENDVKEYVALKNNTPETRRRRRTLITNKIRHTGNKMYNTSIIDGTRSDPLLPAKRGSSRRPVTNITHVCCNHCSGFFRKRSLYRHLQNCERYDESGRYAGSNVKNRRILSEHAGLIVKRNENTDELLRTEVFPKMQKDESTIVAQGDSLICRYGSDFRFTHRGTKQVRYCSSRMRSLARLYLTMKSLNPDINAFTDCIAPQHFDLLVASVRQMSKFDPDSGHTKAPSVPPRLCSSLKRCANIIKSDAIKSDSLTREEKTETVCRMNDFLHLMNKDWCTEVGSISENSRRRIKVIKRDLLPDPDDIRTFSEYIHALCPRYLSDLKFVPTVKNYEKLAKLAIVHIITLNRRRPNETAEITIEAYRSTLNERIDYGHDTQTAVTEEELQSGRQLVIFYVAGNKNLKKVPVLLTRVFHEAVETLIESHEKIGITSKYIFARPGGRDGTVKLFDGSAVLREIANKAKLKSPSTFTANALRHHAATSSQLQSRDDTYAKRLSKFMGHDLRTHEHYYEMPLPLVQKTIVGHQLLKMVLPKTSSVSKPTTSAAVVADATITSAVTATTSTAAVVPNDCTEMTDFQAPSPAYSPITSDSSLSDVFSDLTIATRNKEDALRIDDDARQPSIVDQSETTKLAARENSETPRPRKDDTTAMAAVETETLSAAEKSVSDSTPPRKVHNKRRWSLAEKKTIYQTFGQQFLLKLRPARREIQTVWEKEPALRSRTLQQVVTYVNNIVNNKHHIPTPTRKKIKNMVARGGKDLSP